MTEIDDRERSIPLARDFKAVPLASLSGVVLYLFGMSWGSGYQGPLLLGGPLVVGLVAGLASPRRPISNAVLSTSLLLMLSIFALREGFACVLFVSPLLYGLVVLGAVCGKSVRDSVAERRRRRQIGSLFVALGLGWQALDGWLDDPARHPRHEAAASIEIAASPEVVFARLTERPLEVPQRWQWFMRLGLPMARRLEVLEPRVGGRVRMEQSFGTVHARIRELEPARTFAYDVEGYDVSDPPFHITRLGRGPHFGLRPERVDDWLTVVDTRYELEPLPGGRARLTRRMSWRRHLGPGFYFAPLQQAVLERGQARLLDLIRETVEHDAGAAGSVARR